MPEKPAETISTQHESPIGELLKSAASDLANARYQEAHTACIEALKLNPQEAEAYYLLGVLTAEHDNHAKACEIFDRAIAAAPSRAKYHGQKARSLIALNRRADAVASARKAAALVTKDAHAHDTIGVVFSRAGLHEDAVPHYEAATRLEPGRFDYWYNRAAAEQFLGKLEDAARAYRQTITLKPDHVKAWTAWTQLKRHTADENPVAELQALFERNTDPNERHQLGHAVAKAYEDIGDVAQSMAWLRIAKHAKQEARGAPIVDSALFAAAANTAQLKPAASKSAASPIFIVGLPRTGTTLVDRILSSHPNIVSAGELTDFAVELKRAVKTTGRHVLDTETLTAAASADLGAVGEAYLESAGRIAGAAPRFIDKMPLNIFYAGVINAALPDARIICLRRHPADSVLSNYRQLFATDFSYYDYALDLETAARYFVEFDKLAAAFRETLPQDRFTETHYETIVSDIESEARRLIAFCGEDWDPACLAFHENAAPVATASSAQVRQPLYSSSVGRWKRYQDEMKPALDILAEHGRLTEPSPKIPAR